MNIGAIPPILVPKSIRFQKDIDKLTKDQARGAIHQMFQRLAGVGALPGAISRDYGLEFITQVGVGVPASSRATLLTGPVEA